MDDEEGFNSKRNIRQCQRCKNIIREEFDIETSRWVCPICKTPTPKRQNREIKDRNDEKEYFRLKQEEHRQKYSLRLRSGDKKNGTGYLGCKLHTCNESEQKEIRKEFKRLKLQRRGGIT